MILFLRDDFDAKTLESFQHAVFKQHRAHTLPITLNQSLIQEGGSKVKCWMNSVGARGLRSFQIAH